MFTLKRGGGGGLFLSLLAEGSSVFFKLFLGVCARESVFILFSEIYWKE